MHARALVPVALVGTLLGGCADSTPVGLPAARLLGDAAAVASAAPGVTALTWNVYVGAEDRKSTRLNSSHGYISYAVFCLKKKKTKKHKPMRIRATLNPTYTRRAT